MCHRTGGFFSYHATARRLINEGKLKGFYYSANHNGICPALVLLFDDQRHPVMPIREARWDEYTPVLPPEKEISTPE